VAGRAEAVLKRIVARLAGKLLLAGGGSRPPPEMIRRVLVIRIDERVGNVLLTTPLLAQLRSALPDARIEVLVASSKRSVVDGIAHVVPFDKRALFRAPWRFLSAMFRLRRARYDAVIDASQWHAFSVTSAMVMAWTAAPIRIAHARGEASRYATVTIPAPSGPEPEVHTKLRLLSPLGIETGDPAMRTDLGRAGPGAERMGAWFDQTFGDDPVLGLIPGARKHDHRSAPEIFVALADEARALGAGVLVLWGPGEADLANHVAAEANAVVAPASNLDELAALIRRCTVIASNDTGPMHLSVATGTPTVGLFVQADHGRWGHDYGAHRVIPGHGRDPGVVVTEARAAVRDRLGGSGDRL